MNSACYANTTQQKCHEACEAEEAIQLVDCPPHIPDATTNRVIPDTVISPEVSEGFSQSWDGRLVIDFEVSSVRDEAAFAGQACLLELLCRDVDPRGDVHDRSRMTRNRLDTTADYEAR